MKKFPWPKIVDLLLLQTTMTMNDDIHHSQSDNVDPAEIGKFSELAARWWDRESEFRPLHDINPLRLNFIDQHTP